MLEFIRTIINALKMYIDEKLFSSKADWNQDDASAENYIKNRPFYETKPVEVVLVDNFTSEDYDSEDVERPACNFVPGTSYKVIWNGKVYDNLVCYFDGYNIIASSNNGYPFYIDDDGGDTLYVESYDGDTWAVSIIEYQKELKTIDHKYIKDMYYDNGNVVTELVPGQTITGFTIMEDPIYFIENPFSLNPVKDATYLVNWDGVEYELTCESHNGLICIGNTNYVNMQPGGDIPFAIITEDGSVFITTESTSESHTISVTEIKRDLKQLDVKYLPIMEECWDIIFEKNDFLHATRYEDDKYKKIIGKYRLTVDDSSEIIEFFDDGDCSWAECSFCDIETWDGGIWFYFYDGESHNVKIEKYKFVVKEEHLPDDIGKQSDWSVNDENDSAYIKNRPFYEEFDGEVILDEVYTIEENTYYLNLGYDLTYLIPNLENGKQFTVLLDGKTHYGTFYFGDESADTIIVDFNETYYSGETEYHHSMSITLGGLIYTSCDREGCPKELSVGSHTIKIIDGVYTIKQIDEKYLPEKYATIDLIENKMDKENPIGIGSFSMNRQENSIVGQYSSTFGYKTIATKPNMMAFGTYNNTYIETFQYDFVKTGVGGLIKVSMSDSYYVENNKYVLNNPSLQTHLEDVPVGYYFMTFWTGGYDSGACEKSSKIYKAKSLFTNNDGIVIDVYELVEEDYIETIGNGKSDTERSNAHTLDLNGNAWFSGDVYVGSTSGTNRDDGSKKLATEEYVDNILAGKSVFHHFIMKDTITGYNYIIEMNNGSLISYCADIINATLISPPTKTNYILGERFDASGMIIMLECTDGCVREAKEGIDYTCPIVTDSVTKIACGEYYFEFDTTTASIEDFFYTANDDGTYTINSWKHTLNGKASTEMVFPDSSLVVVEI